MNPQLNALRGLARDAKQLDAIAQFLGIANILAGQLRNAFGVGLVELHGNAECDGAHDGELVRGINTFNVKGRVSFGIAQFLRLGEHFAKRQALVAHLGQDEIGCAVDDAGNPFDAICGQAFAQCLDDRNPSRHRRLEGHHDALFLCGSEYFITMRRQQRLVGSHHVLAIGNGFQHKLLGHRVPTDQFDDDVDLRIGDHLVGIGSHGGLAAGDLSCTLQVLVGHLGNDNTATGPTGDFLLIARQHFPGTAADGPYAQQAYID